MSYDIAQVSEYYLVGLLVYIRFCVSSFNILLIPFLLNSFTPKQGMGL